MTRAPKSASEEAEHRRMRGLPRGIALLAPGVGTAILCFRAGGFYPEAVAWTDVLLVMLVVAHVTMARRPFAGWSRAVACMTAGLALLTAWSLLSALWSHAPGRAVIEADLVLLYTLVAVLGGAAARREGDIDRVLSGVALAFAVTATAALATRLAPGTFPADTGPSPSRLAFPLTYWNTLGLVSGLGLILALHFSASGRAAPATRVVASGAMPLLAVALFFTFSRGAIAVTAIGLVAYAALARSRWLLTAVAAAALPTAAALAAAYSAEGLATAEYARATSEAARVTAAVIACVVAAMGLRALALRSDRRLVADRELSSWRLTAMGPWIAAALAALVLFMLVMDLPGAVVTKAQDFARPGGVPAFADQRDRLTQASANGRLDHWRVAVDAWSVDPLKGTGAGTYQLEWQSRRRETFDVVNAHSLYLEVLSELGVPGLLLLLLALVTPLVVAWRRLRGLAAGPEREAHAAFLAAALALLLHAGLDWDWEMPAVVVWFAGAGAVICARARGVDEDASPSSLGHFARVSAGLAVLVLALAPATVAVSQTALVHATQAFKRGDCAATVDAALESLGVLNQRPEPFELLGYCDIRLGHRSLAVRMMRAARDRDPRDWQYAYGLAIASALAGQDPRPMAAEALALNPHEVLIQDFSEALRGGRRSWMRAAAAAQVPLQ